jgi:hypothetical protein
LDAASLCDGDFGFLAGELVSPAFGGVASDGLAVVALVEFEALSSAVAVKVVKVSTATSNVKNLFLGMEWF